MAQELGKGAQCFRILFIIINLIFVALGLAVLAVGIWLVVAAEDEDDEVESFTGDGYVAGGALLIVAAVVTLVISGVGVFGAIFKLRVILVIYMIFVAILVIIEIAAAAIGFIYQDELRDEIEDRFSEAIDGYAAPDDPDYNEDDNDAVEFVQEEFECCGASNWTEWLNNTDALCEKRGAPSCDCDPLTESPCIHVFIDNHPCGGDLNFTVWNTGCVDELEEAVEEFAIVLGGIAIAVGVVEILGILIALGLCLCITASVKETIV